MIYEESEEEDIQIDMHNESVVLAVIKGELTFGWGAAEMQGVDPFGWSDKCDQDDANANYLQQCLETYCRLHQIDFPA